MGRRPATVRAAAAGHVCRIASPRARRGGCVGRRRSCFRAAPRRRPTWMPPSACSTACTGWSRHWLSSARSWWSSMTCTGRTRPRVASWSSSRTGSTTCRWCCSPRGARRRPRPRLATTIELAPLSVEATAAMLAARDGASVSLLVRPGVPRRDGWEPVAAPAPGGRSPRRGRRGGGAAGWAVRGRRRGRRDPRPAGRGAGPSGHAVAVLERRR